jgi:hypothetical protein
MNSSGGRRLASQPHTGSTTISDVLSPIRRIGTSATGAGRSDSMFIKMIKHSVFTGNTADFVAKDHFVVRFEPVRISYVGQNIRDYFWDKTIPPMESRDVVAYLLGQSVSTRDLI